MAKKISIILAAALQVALLSGCWSYIGLNQISIATAIAMDIDEETGGYIMNFEIVDLANSSKEGTQGVIIESRGSTVFEAIRDAKKMLSNKLYFGNTNVLIISEKVTAESDLYSIMDFFMRDHEPRESMNLFVSQEKTAKEILTAKTIDNSLVGNLLVDLVQEDNKALGASVDVKNYQIYDMLIIPCKMAIMVPSLHLTKNNDKDIMELSGVSIFKDGKLTGSIESDETKYYLICANKLEGGFIIFDKDNERKERSSFEISEAKCKKSFEYKDGKLTVFLDVHIKGNLVEIERSKGVIDMQEINQFKQKLRDHVYDNIASFVRKTQTDYNADIFAVGHMIYKKDKKLWEQLYDDWENIYPNIDMQLSCEVAIKNSGYIK